MRFFHCLPPFSKQRVGRDLKALVEDYIDNKSAVRLIVGLGPRINPSFYRLDVYAEMQGGGGEMTVNCGICDDTITPTEGFACNCLVKIIF